MGTKKKTYNPVSKKTSPDWGQVYLVRETDGLFDAGDIPWSDPKVKWTFSDEDVAKACDWYHKVGATMPKNKEELFMIMAEYTMNVSAPYDSACQELETKNHQQQQLIKQLMESGVTLHKGVVMEVVDIDPLRRMKL